MKHLHRILPVVAIAIALGAAIYHVRASAVERQQAVERPAAPDLSKASGAPGSVLPPSSRYSGSSAAN